MCSALGQYASYTKLTRRSGAIYAKYIDVLALHDIIDDILVKKHGFFAFRSTVLVNSLVIAF